MADKVVLNSEEYNQISEKLATRHVLIKTSFETISKEILGMLGENNGFQVDNSTEKVKDLLQVINGDIMPILGSVFDITEKSMENMVNTIVNTDTMC